MDMCHFYVYSCNYLAGAQLVNLLVTLAMTFAKRTGLKLLATLFGGLVLYQNFDAFNLWI